MSSSGGDDARQLFERAAELAARAVAFDRSGHQEAAVYHYVQAAGALLEARRSGADIAHLEKRANDYLSRAEQLSETAARAVPVRAPTADGGPEMERVYFLMSQALDEDEAGNAREALQLYGQAVELCIEANKKFPSTKFTEAAEQALGRAERLKANLGADLDKAPPPLPELDDLPELNLPELNLQVPSAPPAEPPAARSSGAGSAPSPSRSPRPGRAPLHRGFSSGLQVSGSDAYTKDELRVLAATSRINDNVFVPFMAADLRERFASPLPFTDRAGTLALSPKQRRDFSRWARPDELSDQPCMIQKIDCFSIKQTCISDCSFVASLAVSALYEKRFDRPLITSIIYPRSRDNKPVYNPCGKYMVRLHINGVPRKVVIDDQLPVDRHGRLLCSYSADRRELWVSLLEKAYMKVMGGYDFPGSNSNIDLYALTGWIPERQSIRPGDPEFNADAVFRRLHDCHQKGQVLITVATGDLSEQVAERAGLVPTHAYAVLDIREVQGQRLLLLKNPWSHLRWKGNFSEMDQRHWTPALRKALSYDPQSAQQFDNGVFWIDYDSLCRFFDVFYMSWNPQLFSHTFCHHQTWSAGLGPIRDMYNIGDNPQYRLEVRGPTVVWVLLSRHITEIEDFRNNKEYITVAVYRTDGSRVFYPNDPEPYMDGVRINSPHYLCKLTLKEPGNYTFTFVIAQYEKLNTIHYTLRAYSASPFSLKKLSWLPTQHTVTGEWKGVTAGGCTNHPQTHPNNPVYQLQLTGPAAASVTLQLKGPRVYQMGMDVTCVEAASDAPGYFRRKSSGSYRSGFVVLALENVPRGVYNIVPSTYLPGQEGPFILSLLAVEPAKLVRIK